MKRLASLAAMLALVLVASAPALAQVEQESEQEGESGEEPGSDLAEPGEGSESDRDSQNGALRHQHDHPPVPYVRCGPGW